MQRKVLVNEKDRFQDRPGECLGGGRGSAIARNKRRQRDSTSNELGGVVCSKGPCLGRVPRRCSRHVRQVHLKCKQDGR